MSTEIIPADERGEFTFTPAQLVETDATTWAAFEVLLLDEARRRGLEISVEDVVFDGGLRVRWRPERRLPESEQ